MPETPYCVYCDEPIDLKVSTLCLNCTRIPYPEFCRHPVKCAGRGSCPRDISCAD